MFVSVQRFAQTSFRIFLQIRKMVYGAKFNSHDSHDSGSHSKKLTFKNGHWKKHSQIFVTELEVASKIEHAVAT